MERVFLTAASQPASLQVLDVRADDADARDYVFSPSLDLLPEELPPPAPGAFRVLQQQAEGACVGFALAAVINLSLARRRSRGPLRRRWPGAGAKPEAPPGDDHLASERMLYELAKRYDEWRGEHYEGTSLRGAMKGWHKHGVCSRRLWPYRPGEPGHLTLERRDEALGRPLGAYYRILDSDVGHLQAAIAEGDAVLASAWIHPGWREGQLLEPQGAIPVKRIPLGRDVAGLHAFAVVGYCPQGFVIQNSWGEAWGTGGLALLSYDDWFENRQDAWVARPGATAHDSGDTPRLFLVGFQGASRAAVPGRAGTSGAEGLDLRPEALSFLINTGDRGALSETGRLRTPPEDLPEMAARVRLTGERNGFRDVVLYAHGGLTPQTRAAEKAGALWAFCNDRPRPLTAYFFVWETGLKETTLGFLRSRDDAAGPRAGFDLGAAVRDLAAAAKRRLQAAQRGVGKAFAPVLRPGWREMKLRAQGAAAAAGGARLFTDLLLREMVALPGPPFRLHLFGHSAGAVYVARLWDGFLRGSLAGTGGKVRLGSIRLFGPSLTLADARALLAPQGQLPPGASVHVHVLADADEAADGIGIYPSSLLTYVADHLEDAGRRVPLLGIGRDLTAGALAALGGPTRIAATRSTKHGGFDEPGHEVEAALTLLAGP